MGRIYAGLAAAAVAGLLGGTLYTVLVARAPDPFAACRNGVVVGGDIGGPFTLLDTTGATVTDADVITRPSLIYFGYTSCPDVCPLDNARNSESVELLAQSGVEAQAVFISIDPERDTPETMADYIANLDPAMIGLTGSAEQVKAASEAYKTYYRKQEGGGAYYLMDHTTFTYLMLPGLGFADFFRRDETAAAVADRVRCIIGQAAA